MNRTIKKVAVLGSGVMGSRIACHFANIGVNVLLLDIVPKEPNEAEAAKGLTTKDKAVRNRIVNEALAFALKSNPSPIYKKSFASRVTTGNFEDNMKDIATCDWVIEVVVERLDIKKLVFDQVEQFRKPGTLITSNTSGIPIHLMNEGRSEDFRKHFCGTHFFNPPRYLKLLEIIPTPETDQKVVDFLMEYGDLYLGKTTVLCKDTPAFIANRVGVAGIMGMFHIIDEMGMTIEEVDKLTGPVLGRPKSATFRTGDVVGLDTLVNVANGLRDNLPNDEAKHTFELPGYLVKMVENKWLGDKTKQGFFKKTKNAEGKTEILVLDLKTLEYRPQVKAKFATLEATKAIDSLRERMPVLYSGKDKAGEFYRKTWYALFQYVSNRIPEITDELYKIDDAMAAGFGWEIGPFDNWDVLGVEKVVKDMEAADRKPAQWVYDMLAAGITSFYKIENGVQKFYDIPSKAYKAVPGRENFIILDTVRHTKKPLYQNAGASIHDIGDGIINIEFHSKMNSLGQEVLEAINKGIDMAEKDYRGVVISNDGPNFSAGANIAMIFMLAIEQEYDELDFAIRYFQNTVMRLRYSSIPVVTGPKGLALGGGCELNLHADRVVAAAETYMGLVELGVGVIPAGGGTKEFVVRASDAMKEGDIQTNTLRNNFLTIGMAKVSTSAHEAYDIGVLQQGKDIVVVNSNRVIAEAKRQAILMADEGYTQPAMRKDIKVLGRSGLGMVYAGANTMYSGKYISEHDKLISEKLGYVMCGGDLSAPTEVSEQYLLDLEREAFLSLCGTEKTLKRLESIIKFGKPLRN